MKTPPKLYKTVLLLICVPEGDYCWGPGEEFGETRICSHFDNEGGYPVCGLNIDTLKYDKRFGVKKPEKCLGLKEA